MGYRYVYGTSGPNTFDCSGFTKFVYAHFGVSLPHSTNELNNNTARYGTVVSSANARPGDLVLWNGHVGIYEGNGMCINALNPSRGVCEIAISSFS